MNFNFLRNIHKSRISFFFLVLFINLINIPINTSYSNQLKEKESNNLVTPRNINRDIYILGPGDVLALDFFNTSEFSRVIEILNDGSVQIPFSKSIYISGLTIDEASSLIKSELERELLNPLFQLTIKRYRPIKVSLIGEISMPGIYSLTPKEESKTSNVQNLRLEGLPTLVDAIQKSGGFTQKANLREVSIKRILPGNDSKYKMRTFDLIDLIKNGNQKQNPYLFDGDIIETPRVEKIETDIMEISSANLSPRFIEVTVLGEVASPGNFSLPINTPLVQSILRAGGPLDLRTSYSKVELIRINRDGTAFRKRYSIDLSQGLSSKKNPPLKNGDFVYVRKSLFGKSSDAITSISKPLTGLVTIWSLVNLVDN